MLKKKVLKQNNLLRLQKRLAVVMLALTLGLGTGCGKTDDGADGAASSEAETLADGQTNDQTDAGAEEENGQESKKDNDEPYAEGTYSSDAYDVAEFTAEPRKKTDEEGNRGVYYEIFVRSFADSDGDGIGDLNGVTEKLDYLKELGIDGIWLMPITASDTYHGYSVTDYMAVNPDYGTEDDLKRLLDEAHSRDMKVIMDLVINHTSINHPWFQAAKSDENSEYRDYYRWVYKTDKKDCNHLLDKSSWGDMVWHQEGDFYYYGVFGADMPDLNYNNPDVRQAAKDAAGHWLELGLDGFRMDAAVHIYGAHEFKQQEEVIRAEAAQLFEEVGDSIDFKVGTMIEIPRAALTADRIASSAEFFSFGTNDLTQMTFGYSRDDIASFLPIYLEKKILKVDPFQVLDQNGVGQLVRMATEKGRAIRPDLKCGICGEHGGEPSSVKFCHKVGLNYVSCSPFRVPIARLAAAQAAIEDTL